MPVIFKSEKFNNLRHKTHIFTQKLRNTSWLWCIDILSSDVFSHLCSGRGTWKYHSPPCIVRFLEICMKAEDFIDSNNFVVGKLSLGLI